MFEHDKAFRKPSAKARQNEEVQDALDAALPSSKKAKWKCREGAIARGETAKSRKWWGNRRSSVASDGGADEHASRSLKALLETCKRQESPRQSDGNRTPPGKGGTAGG